MKKLVNFKNLSLTRFIEEVEANNYIWAAKRLSGNDTGLTGSHQVGLYLPHLFFQKTLPEICTIERHNPSITIKECYFSSHDHSIEGLRVVYYNSKFFPEKNLKKQYNEFRITRWGGRSSPVQDVENTGSILIFAIDRKTPDFICAVAWISSSIEEEDLIESWLGREIEPGSFQMNDCISKPKEELELPEKWFENFPSGKEIFHFVLQNLPRNQWKKSVDELLLQRRKLEFEVFERIEKADVLPKVRNGFQSVESFIRYAHSISNRRKSRTGTSLELNLECIFKEENLLFETQVMTENK